VKAAADEKKEKLVEGEEFSEEEEEVIDIEKIRKEQRDDHIRKIYEKADVTQKEVGEMFGITSSTSTAS
jgi:hypothetical protein